MTAIKEAYRIFRQTDGNEIEITQLKRKKPLLAGLTILLDWSIILGCIVLAENFWSIWLYLMIVPIIGSRMMAFAALTHDASHFLLFKKGKVNTWIGELLLAWPIFGSLIKYRQEHMSHHSFLRSEKDPERPLEQYQAFQFPLSPARWYAILILDLLGINFIYYQIKKRFGKRSKPNPQKTSLTTPRLYNIFQFTYYLSIFGLFIFMDWWSEFLLFWIIPYITWFAMAFRIRACSEHFHISEKSHFQTRSLKLNLLEKFFFFPHGLQFHSEHHLCPTVPFHKLQQLNQNLLKSDFFVQNTHFTHGISGLFFELTHDLTFTRND